MDVILDMIDDGLPVDMLFFDFSKAFDTVPHHRLLVKLETYGITGGTLEIIQDFLADRWMRVGVKLVTTFRSLPVLSLVFLSFHRVQF